MLHHKLNQEFTLDRGYGIEKIDHPDYRDIWFVIPQPLPKSHEVFSNPSLDAEEHTPHTLAVIGYARAMEKLIKQISKEKFTAVTHDLFRSIHKAIVDLDPSYDGIPGEYRAEGRPGAIVQVGGLRRREESTYNPKEAILHLPLEWKKRLTARRHSTAERLLEQLTKMPVFSAQEVTNLLNVTLPAALHALKQLEQDGIISEKSGRQRKQKFVADEVLAIVGRKYGSTPDEALALLAERRKKI